MGTLHQVPTIWHTIQTAAQLFSASRSASCQLAVPVSLSPYRSPVLPDETASLDETASPDETLTVDNGLCSVRV
jgi:hypothetical protein